MITHRAAPTIETARLRLRAYTQDDFGPILAMVSDGETMRHISGAQSREEAWRRMLAGPGCWALLGYGYWVVERRSDGAVIGQAGLADFKRDMEPSIEGIPELGYVFHAQVHGQGYASEAVSAILAWTDREFNGTEVVAIIAADNLPSIRLAERNGFSQREQATYKAEPIEILRRSARRRTD